MGLIGALLALHLQDRKIPFTWSDKEGVAPDPYRPTRATAWRASTGCCYPSDDPKDLAGYFAVRDRLLAHAVVGRYMTSAAYGYSAAKPPHFKNDTMLQNTRVFGRLSFLGAKSYHLNVPDLVLDVRQRFGLAYRETAPPGAKIVVTHGFSRRAQTVFFWGWHTKVHLRLTGALQDRFGESPICLNLQHMRYGTWYAYPVPPSPKHRHRLYFLGTSIIHQKQPRELEVRPKFDRMLGHLLAVSEGQVVVGLPPDPVFIQGWRPKCLTQGPEAWREDGVIYIRPQYASGFRHYIHWLEATLELLRLEGLA